MKYLIFLFVALYLYSVSYGIFLTEMIRIPAPLLFCMPLITLFKEDRISFLYGRELLVILLATFLYDVVGLSDHKVFLSNLINISMCALFFNYFSGTNRTRFKVSIYVFYGLLLFSAFVLVLNPFYPEKINALRSLLMGEQVIQSPSGIAIYQFNFGYQLAALVPFLFIYSYVYKKHLLIKAAILLSCLIFIYLGMQRSVFIGFICASFLFLWAYYRYKAVLIVVLAVVAGTILYTFVLKDNFDSYNNILSKNEQSASEYDRTTLTAENLRICAEYPYGLIFYGKTWGDVIYRNQVFSSGITSHNAYLMFLTYLGPILGIALLIALYYKVLRIAIKALREVRKKENAMMVCLCGAFLAVSINSLSHNSWLLSGNGPTFFLYFAILHLHFLNGKEGPVVEEEFAAAPQTAYSGRYIALQHP